MITESVTMLNDKVASLHLKINDVDLYNKRKNLEINGLPEYRNESCKKLVVRVLKHIDPTFRKDGLNVVHRIGKQNSTNCNKKKGCMVIRFKKQTNTKFGVCKQKKLMNLLSRISI